MSISVHTVRSISIPVAPIPPKQAVNFDGSVDYLERVSGGLGASDNKLLTLSVWLRYTNDLENSTIVYAMDSGESAVLSFIRNATEIQIETNVGANLQATTNGTTPTNNQWTHFIISFDLSNPSNRHIYLNGVSHAAWTTYTDSNIDWSGINDTFVSANKDTKPENDSMDMAELWITNEYIDLSVGANLAKFASGTPLAPVDLGSDGSTPTGTQPLIFFSGNASAGWNSGTNKGSGGSFTMNGSVTNSANEPIEAGS